MVVNYDMFTMVGQFKKDKAHMKPRSPVGYPMSFHDRLMQVNTLPSEILPSASLALNIRQSGRSATRKLKYSEPAGNAISSLVTTQPWERLQSTHAQCSDPVSPPCR